EILIRRRKVPGGAAGLQNQSGSRKVPGGFDSLPSPPAHFFAAHQFCRFFFRRFASVTFNDGAAARRGGAAAHHSPRGEKSMATKDPPFPSAARRMAFGCSDTL